MPALECPGWRLVMVRRCTDTGALRGWAGPEVRSVLRLRNLEKISLCWSPQQVLQVALPPALWKPVYLISEPAQVLPSRNKLYSNSWNATLSWLRILHQMLVELRGCSKMECSLKKLLSHACISLPIPGIAFCASLWSVNRWWSFFQRNVLDIPVEPSGPMVKWLFYEAPGVVRVQGLAGRYWLLHHCEATHEWWYPKPTGRPSGRTSPAEKSSETVRDRHSCIYQHGKYSHNTETEQEFLP